MNKASNYGKKVPFRYQPRPLVPGSRGTDSPGSPQVTGIQGDLQEGSAPRRL